MHLAISISVQLLAAALVLLTAPLFVDLTVALLGNRRRSGAGCEGNGEEIRLAVVIPAHNEARMVARTVRSLLAAGCAAGPAREEAGEAWKVPVFVVAHNCSDATATAGAAAGACVLELSDPKMRGKGAALRFGLEGARRAGANAFLAMDADSIASSNLIDATRAALGTGAGAVQCRYELEKPAGLSARGRLRVLAFRGVNVLRARGRARLGFSAGIFGNGFAVTQATLERAPFSADSICEDLEYHIGLVCAGVRVGWIDEAVVWAPLSAPGSAQATQEARWEGGRAHVALRGAGRLLQAALSGNWRALATLAEAWSLPLSRGVAALLLAALLPVHWLHLYAMVCGSMVAAYVVEAAVLGGEPARDLAALAVAPAHLGWKLLITPLAMRQTRKRAEWVRTEREAQQP